MDDIVIYTKTYRKNEKRTRQVIQILTLNGLKSRYEKCKLFTQKTELLGLEVCPQGISVKRKSTSAIEKWVAPKTLKQIQSFLGFTIYLRSFVHGYSDLIRPIQKLVHGQKKSILWNVEAENSFVKIKNAFKKTENLFFNLPTIREQKILKCDASDTACGSVLMTVKSGFSISDISEISDAEIATNPDFKICSCSSHMFSTTEQRFTTIEIELMAIVTGLQAYNTVVRSSELTAWILTDHRNLLFLRKFELSRRRHFKWFEILCNYNYEIAFVQGFKNEVADGLSRPNAFYQTQEQVIFQLSECKMINTLKDFDKEKLKRIQSVHESSTWNHPGIRNMIYIQKFEEVVSGINRSEVEMVVKHCDHCQRMKNSRITQRRQI
jgi:RNase H-like domain found in reverse transcriptase